ncbi:transcription initiation factor IID, 18kD subunit-domain-containing protein [Entophlyctis helioformis]|nr:transcription initiation factor IID, 18kD subunit-domain-containing protein [Entophlyctis helioformis]
MLQCRGRCWFALSSPMKRKRVFVKEVRNLLYGFGDVPNPLPETAEALDELLEWYITDLCDMAMSRATGKLKTSDFLGALAKDPKKLARAHELLKLEKELKNARAAFDVQEIAGVPLKAAKRDNV